MKSAYLENGEVFTDRVYTKTPFLCRIDSLNQYVKIGSINDTNHFLNPLSGEHFKKNLSALIKNTFLHLDQSGVYETVQTGQLNGHAGQHAIGQIFWSVCKNPEWRESLSVAPTVGN